MAMSCGTGKDWEELLPEDCDCGRYLVYECMDELYSIAPELHYPRRPQLQHASGPNMVALTRDMATYIDARWWMTGWFRSFS